jgi:hypothetical protein
VATVVFDHHLDVPDLGPLLQQVVPELVEPGARLYPRRVVALQQLDPAYPAGEELVRRASNDAGLSRWTGQTAGRATVHDR